MKILALSLLFFTFSCGDATSSLLSNDGDNLKKDFDISENCETDRSSTLVDNAIMISQRLGNACELQNVSMKKNGYKRCPTNTCMASHEIGGLQSPSIEIKLTNSSSSSSFGYSSYSSMSSGGRGDGENIYVTLTLKMNLAKDPDKITCVNPLSPVSIDKIMDEVINITKTNPKCG